VDSAPIRILVVDDHQLVREGIAGFLAVQPDMTLVGEAANGREAIQQFRTHRPDVTLMDLQMPEMNGLDALIGGKLAVWSEVGGGTEIELRVPASAVYLTAWQRSRLSRLLPSSRSHSAGGDA